MMINWEEGRFMKIKAIYRGGKNLYLQKNIKLFGQSLPDEAVICKNIFYGGGAYG